MKQINRKTAFIILLVFAILFFSASRNNRNKYETTQNEMIQYVSKHLKRQEIETRNRIRELETKIETVKQSETILLKRIETAENNYKNIVRNLKSIDNDKTKKDIEIIHSDSDSDWDWFNRRFPKSKNDN
jgi:septal ring factor EnvC (AmiA/AmiB activator)